MKKVILLAIIACCCSQISYAQINGSELEEQMRQMQEQMQKMLENMHWGFGDTPMMSDSMFLMPFDNFHPEDFERGDSPFLIDTTITRSFGFDGENWKEFEPKEFNQNLKEMMDRMNQYFGDMRSWTDENLDQWMEDKESSPAIPQPEDLEQQEQNNPKKEAPTKKKKKRKTYSL